MLQCREFSYRHRCIGYKSVQHYNIQRAIEKKRDHSNCDQNKSLGHWHRGCSLVVRERKEEGSETDKIFMFCLVFLPYSFENNKDGGWNRATTILHTWTLMSFCKFQSKSSVAIDSMRAPPSVPTSRTISHSSEKFFGGVNTKSAKASTRGKRRHSVQKSR